MYEVNFDNLVTAAVRGRNNPAMFAKLVRKLRDELNLSWKDIAAKTGYSVMTIKNYYDIASLPEEVLQLIAAGKLSVSKAVLLLELPDAKSQISCAEDIVRYGYSEYQAKEHVKYYLELLEDIQQPVRPTLIKPKSESSLLCDVCQRPIEEEAMYHWFHPECWQLTLEALRYYVETKKSEEPESQSPESSQ
jgi:transcriptional regulator with XRE-family HTH domain